MAGGARPGPRARATGRVASWPAASASKWHVSRPVDTNYKMSRHVLQSIVYTLIRLSWQLSEAGLGWRLDPRPITTMLAGRVPIKYQSRELPAFLTAARPAAAHLDAPLLGQKAWRAAARGQKYNVPVLPGAPRGGPSPGAAGPSPGAAGPLAGMPLPVTPLLCAHLPRSP